MPERPTEIYRAANSQHAQLLRGLLAEGGIQSFVINDLAGAGGELPLWTAGPRILVAEEDAVEGRLIAEMFDVALRDGSADAAEEFENVDADWEDWPACSQCGQRREVLCDVCGSRGSSFPLAGQLDEPAGPAVLLHCDTCDDHFRPKFFRTCHHCGHDFGGGIELEPAQQQIPLPSNTLRTWIVTCGLLTLASLLGLYLYWLANH